MRPPRASGRGARVTLGLLFAVNVLNFFDRQILSAVTEPIRREWGLGDAAMGALGTAFTLVYAAVGLPLGWLSDRVDRGRLIGAGVAFWSAMTALCGWVSGFAGLFAARLGVGLGEAALAPAANALIGDLFPPERRARALSLFMLGLPIGISLSYAVSGELAARFGWRAAFVLPALPGFVLAVLVFRIGDPRAAVGWRLPRDPHAFRAVLSIPTLWWICASGAFHNFNLYAVNAFLPAYLSRSHGLTLRASTSVSAVVLGVVGIVGLSLGGVVADRVARKGLHRRPLVAAAALALSAPLAWAALSLGPGRVREFALLMGGAVALMQVYYATIYACIHDVVVPHRRGTALSVYFFVMYVLGASVGPWAMGGLSDRYARHAMVAAGQSILDESHRAAGLHAAFGIVPWLAVGVALTLVAASRTARKDARG